MEQIVFNAASVLPPGMLQACIQAMYGFVDEIIICEGATKKLRGLPDGDATSFTKDGRSTDRTLDVLHSIPDPRNKIKIIPSRGWWDGKTQMMNQCDRLATGDYIWQVDSDEFYREYDIPKILRWIQEVQPDRMDFFAMHFWGGWNDCCDVYERRWGNDMEWRRIFKRGIAGGSWKSHEPPDYQVGNGRLASSGKIMTRDETGREGVYLYHYGYVWRKQAEFKQRFFRNSNYLPSWDAWHRNKKSPIIKGAVTVPFRYRHPEIIMHLMGK